jgi:hypothetical protein
MRPLMRKLTCMAVFLAVSGCVSGQQQTATDDNYCQGIGAVPGTQAYVQCRLQLQAQNVERSRRIGAAISDFSQNMQRNLDQQAQAQRAAQPITCVSQPTLGTVTTTCR